MIKLFVVMVLPGVIVYARVSVGRTADDDTIEESIARQHVRIGEGVARGQLTLGEAEVLAGSLDWIKTEEARLNGLGRPAPRERALLQKALDRNSVMIHEKRRSIRQDC